MNINEISWSEEGDGNVALMESPALADFKDINSLAQAFVDTKAMVGNSIRIPSSEAGAEDLKKFNDTLLEKVPGLMRKPDSDDVEGLTAIMKSLGLPTEVDGYGAVEIDGTLFSEKDIEAMKQDALEAGLTKRQFETQMKKAVERSKSENEEFDYTQNEGMNKLKREWGEAYDMRVAQAGKIAEASGAPTDLVEAIKLGEAPADSVKWLYNLANRIGGEEFQVATQEPENGGITPQEARDRAQEIRTQLNDDSIVGTRRDDLIKRMIDYDKRGAVAA